MKNGKGPGAPVSVVICAYNRYEDTMSCIESVRRHTDPALLAEIVLVDDASTERGLAEMVGKGGLVVVRHRSNTGFLDAANDGASVASGQYLFFLNNDAVVTPGWLEPLLERIQQPRVGAVGAKLVYPDGRLQEAGGIIFTDGTGWNLGRGGDKDDLRYNFPREVDYCSGAALMVRRDLFLERGGFDRVFAPGYYEEVDFCFYLRSRGYRVMYEPRSTVIHHEGLTFGNDEKPGSGLHRKSRQYINRYRLVVRWQDALARQYRSGSNRAALGTRRPDRPTVLICDHKVPEPDVDSGSVRLWWILRLLVEAGFPTSFYPVGGWRDIRYLERLQALGVEVHDFRRGPAAAWEGREGMYDVVMTSRPDITMNLLTTITRYFPNALLVFDTVDLHSLRERRSVDFVQPAAAVGQRRRATRVAEEEHSAICASDLVATVTDEEANFVRSQFPNRTVVVLPNVHELPPELERDPRTRSGLCFIGGYEHTPNIDAVKWLVHEIMPEITNCLGAAPYLNLLGSFPPPEVRALEGDGVAVPGYLADVSRYFLTARVFVAPLRYGAGMKGKIGQAMAFGLPVVTTSLGAEGMDLRDGKDVLIADDARGFAEAVARVYQDDDLWLRLSTRGLEIIAERWSPGAMAKRLEALMESCTPPVRRIPT
ncbi:MAG: glycosyltransferase [Acidimicrobiales bacterium]